MSWRNYSSMKIATLLKSPSSNMALARCSLPTRKYSSALIDLLKTATTANPSNIRDLNSGNAPLQPSRSGNPNSGRGVSYWDAIADQLSAAKKKARLDALAQSNEPPEDVWKRKSEYINSQLRMVGKGGVATRMAVTAQTRKAKGAWAYDVSGLSEAEVPFVASGRTVTSADFGRAIVRLGRILSKNKVRQEWRRDKYFTKPFQLRYQLRSRRHRQRFAAAIRRKVQIVQAIKRRGM